jgi:hypothetical protein
MQPYRKRQNVEDEPSLTDRLLAAALAPLFFNISILIVIAVIGGYSRRLARLLLSGAFFNTTTVVLIVLPAIIGFLSGTNGLVRFLGHAFYTHMESERDFRITVGIWVCISGVAYLLAGAM